MKLSKNVICLEPFIRAAEEQNLIGKVLEVRGFSISRKKAKRFVGHCFRHKNGYNISLLTKHHETITVEDMLYNLAHELAHTVCWEHNQVFNQQLKLIIDLFFDVLAQLGVNDIQQSYMTLNGE